MKHDVFKFQLEIGGSHTIVECKNFCRLEYFLRNPVVIGGPGHTLEIDECLLMRRKYNAGPQVDEQWGFGGYDVVDKVGLMVPVDRRDVATLLHVICQHIVPGTTIISDLGCLQYARHTRLPAHLQPRRPYNWRVYQPH